MKAETQSNNRYWPALDGLRTLAFALVFFHHANPQNRTPSPLLNEILAKVSSWGWTGVDLFFVLSGFLISYLLLQERQKYGSISIKNFYVRRILRIWPLYMILLATLAVVPLAYGHRLDVHLYRPLLTKIIVPYLLFVGNYWILNAGNTLHNLCSSLDINWMFYVTLIGPLWSLCIEEQFYLVCPWILNSLRSVRALWIACTALVVLSLVTRFNLFLYVFNTHQGCEHFRYNSFCHLDALMFGAMLALAETQSPGWAKRYVAGKKGVMALCVVLSIIATTILFAPGVLQLDISIVPLSTLLPATFAALLLLVLNWPPATSFFSNKVLVSIGRVTYAMYLLHLFVFSWIGNFIPASADPYTSWWIGLAAAFATTLIFAKLSWFLIESRMLGLRKYCNRSSTLTGDRQPETKLVSGIALPETATTGAATIS